MTDSVVRIEPLNAENYDTWKLQMKAVLIKNDLWSYVDGSVPCPVAKADCVILLYPYPHRS